VRVTTLTEKQGYYSVRILQNEVMYKRCGHLNSDAILYLILSEFPATTFSCLVNHDKQTRLINRAHLLFSATTQILAQ
jgi:hypothetical protein